MLLKQCHAIPGWGSSGISALTYEPTGVKSQTDLYRHGYLDRRVAGNSQWTKPQNIRGQLCPTWLNIPVPHYINFSGALKKCWHMEKLSYIYAFFVQNGYIVALRKLATSGSCCSQTMIIHMLITPAFR